MSPEITPEGLRRAEFRTTLRGYDRIEVDHFLESVAARLDELEAAQAKLSARLEEMPSKDLEAEFDSVGREVAAILQSAREAAEAMRERATLDAAKWRREAMEESELARREAATDAEALRRDAWVTGSELLEQTSTAAEAMRANAERDVLTVMGEAEREAHRLTSGARREAEDALRSATMESEKMLADAASRRDEIIDGANRQAAAAQERTRALEQRRDELLDELENVRSTLTRLEGSLEERREALDLTTTEPSSVKVVHPPADAKQHWELGETVRVVPPEGKEQSEEPVTPPPVARDEPPVQVTPSEPEPEPEPVSDIEEQQAVEAVVERPTGRSGEGARDDLDALFAALRGGGETVPSAPVVDAGTDQRAPEDRDGGSGVDWIDERESRLLPITNRALRGVKKAMTEIQNVALDSLRTDDGWQPDEKAIAESVHAELVAVWSESFAAGHAVAEEMEGSKIRRPSTPSSKADQKFAGDLSTAVRSALDKAGDGARDRQSAASRVFRVWRSDEAERRIRDIALEAYEKGIEKSRKVLTG